MNLYLIYSIASSKISDENPPFVILEDKFDREAFFKSFYLLLKYKQYKMFLILFSLFMSANLFILNIGKSSSPFLILLLIMLYSGLEGLNWRINLLEKRGYRLASKIYANNYQEALDKFENAK